MDRGPKILGVVVKTGNFFRVKNKEKTPGGGVQVKQLPGVVRVKPEYGSRSAVAGSVSGSGDLFRKCVQNLNYPCFLNEVTNR